MAKLTDRQFLESYYLMLNLVIMAAGLGSRYAGLKQIEGVGPNGEMLMDYSIGEAIRSGFGKIVVIVREDFREQCEQLILSRWRNKAEFEFVLQELNGLPAGFSCPSTRKKPWGTGHALLTAKPAVTGPMCLINADDYYGPDTFAQMAAFLKQIETLPYDAVMVSYLLKNTCSPNGSVTRGVCRLTGDTLATVSERHNIIVEGNRFYWLAEGEKNELPPDTPVSMNFWGFKPDIFSAAEAKFKTFLQSNLISPTAEFLLPEIVNQLVREVDFRVRVLQTSSMWFGMTYPQDRVAVEQHLRTTASPL